MTFIFLVVFGSILGLQAIQTLVPGPVGQCQAGTFSLYAVNTIGE